MRGVPGLRGRLLVQAHAVVMPDLRRAVAALRPVAAGAVIRAGERGAVGLRTGQDVVHVRRIAAPVHHLAFFGQRGLLRQVVGAVQLRDALRHHNALHVLPRTAADAVAGVDGLRALGAQVGAPLAAARPDRGGQGLAQLVRARQATEVGALSGSGAGDEEGHRGRLGVRAAAQAERHGSDRCEQGEIRLCHVVSPEARGAPGPARGVRGG